MTDMSGLITGANLVGGLIRQGQQNQDYVTGLFDQHAKRKAGEALAGGDVDGAAGILGSRGMLDEAQALKDRSATADVLGSINTGDYGAARTKAAGAGNVPLYGQVQGQQQSELKHRAEFMGNAADALSQIHGPDEQSTQALRQKAFADHIAPTLKAMGLGDADIAQVSGSDMSDASIQSFKASLGQLDKLTIQTDTATGDVLGINSQTGEVKVLHKGRPKTEWKELKHADGSSEWIDLNSGEVSDAPPEGGQASASAAAPHGGVYDQISQVAQRTGAKPGEVAYLQRLAQVESNGKPDAKNGSSTGLFQFHPDTFASVGGQNINDPNDQTKAALALSRRDRQLLTDAGIEATDANVYMMHQQGAGGGKALLAASPTANAVDVLTPVYGDAAKAKKAIVGNGGTPDMTAGQFVDYWQRRWVGAKSPAPVKASGGMRRVPGDEAQPEEAPLTKEAVAMIGFQYLRNGPDALKNLGQGKAGVGNKQRILDWAAQTAREAGTDNPTLVARFAETKAAQMSLNQITKVRQQISASEKTVDKNMQIVLSLAPKGAGPTGSPLANMPIQYLRKSVWGSPQVANFDAAIGTVADEYGKVMTTSTGAGGGALSDSARKEAYERLSKASTIPQLQGIVATLRAEMENRVSSYRDQERAALSVISGQAAPPETPAVLPGGSGGAGGKVRTWNPKTGRIE